MKKKLVTAVLCVTMCVTTVLQTGAAAFSSPDDVDSAVLEQNTEAEVYEEAEETADEAEADLFSAGETEGITDVITEELPEDFPEMEDEFEVFSAGLEEEPEEPAALKSDGAILVSAEDWELAGAKKYRLHKPVHVPDAAALDNMTVMEAEMTADDDVTAVQLPVETAQPEEAKAVGDEYFTAKDGLLLISTEYKNVVHTGYYLFDEDGYMVTGYKKIKAGTYGSKVDTEYYFTEEKNAEVYKEFKGEGINPCASTLGQQVRNDWVWTGSAFRFYDENGKFVSVSELKKIYTQTGKYTGYYKIDGEYYCLASDGKPRTGNITITVGSSSGRYYFQPAEKSGEIPGKMFYEGWRTFKGTNGERWVYYHKGGKDIGKLMEHGIITSKLDPEKKGGHTYLIDKYGYILDKTIKKAENGAYYATDSRGVIYREKLVRYNNLRYYFGSNGQRKTWKNGWYRCPGASNRYYYFGSVPGRVEERYGWQKVTTSSGAFYGWFYFCKDGNHYVDKLTGTDYYFTKAGKLAGGIHEVDGRKYLFEVSDENTHRGKMYRNKLVYYKGQYFYASSTGALRKTGWQNVSGYWYCFDNYRAMTNKFAKKNGVNGYLDGSGKYTTGWVIVSNSENKVRYIDPDGDGFVTNGSKWVNGLLYYFDGNGYRMNDVTHIYGGPYYVEVDRINGVMTVYNSAKTVPVKTIRVSVGNSWTPTPTGTYSMTRSLRWQPLMGPSWGQYGTHVDGAGQGGIFVHSVSGSSPNSYSLPAAQYNKLGNPASHGCIRACVGDAKWVYDHCNGATIRIFDGKYNANESMKGPLGRRALVPLRYPYNFDPTDPAI